MANDLAVSRLVEANKQLEQRRPDIQRGLKIGGEMKENQVLLNEREQEFKKVQEDVAERRVQLNHKQTERKDLQLAIEKLQYTLQGLNVYRTLFEKFDIVKSKLKDLENEDINNADYHRTYQEQQLAQSSLRTILDRDKVNLQKSTDLLNTRKSEVSHLEQANSTINFVQLQQSATQNTNRLAALKAAKNLWTRLISDYEIVEKLNAMSPALLDILPLTLEEVFTYEMQALGYNFEKVLEDIASEK